MVVLHAHFGFTLSDKNTEVVTPTPHSKTMWAQHSRVQPSAAQYSPVQHDMIDESSFNDFKIFLYQLALAKTRTNEM